MSSDAASSSTIVGSSDIPANRDERSQIIQLRVSFYSYKCIQN